MLLRVALSGVLLCGFIGMQAGILKTDLWFNPVTGTGVVLVSLAHETWSPDTIPSDELKKYDEINAQLVTKLNEVAKKFESTTGMPKILVELRSLDKPGEFFDLGDWTMVRLMKAKSLHPSLKNCDIRDEKFDHLQFALQDRQWKSWLQPEQQMKGVKNFLDEITRRCSVWLQKHAQQDTSSDFLRRGFERFCKAKEKVLSLFQQKESSWKTEQEVCDTWLNHGDYWYASLGMLDQVMTTLQSTRRVCVIAGISHTAFMDICLADRGFFQVDQLATRDDACWKLVFDNSGTTGDLKKFLTRILKEYPKRLDSARLDKTFDYLAGTLALCSACRKLEAKSQCTGCEKVFYCNRECQKQDWAKHKLMCNFKSKKK